MLFSRPYTERIDDCSGGVTHVAECAEAPECTYQQSVHERPDSSFCPPVNWWDGHVHYCGVDQELVVWRG